MKLERMNQQYIKKVKGIIPQRQAVAIVISWKNSSNTLRKERSF
jgi:hypothetical protein